MDKSNARTVRRERRKKGMRKHMMGTPARRAQARTARSRA